MCTQALSFLTGNLAHNLKAAVTEAISDFQRPVIVAPILGSIRKRNQSQSMYSTREFAGILHVPYNITKGASELSYMQY